jgi:glucose-6-phosphate isomerase
MTFGAWCDRDYGFEYDEVRARGGLAYFPLLSADGRISWQPNPRYVRRSLEARPARAYPELGLRAGEPIYRTFERDPQAVQWVSDPARLARLWPGFEP